MILSVLFCAVAETAWCTVDSGPPPQSPQEGAGGDARSVQCPTSLSVVPGGDSVNSLPLFLVTLSTACPCSSLHCQQSALVSCYTVNSLPLFLVTLFLVTLSTVCPCSSLHCQQFGLVLRYINCLTLFFVTLSKVCPCSSLHCQQFGLVLRCIVNCLPLFLVTLSTVWPCSSLQWTKAKSLSRLRP